jgi:hypothetical protein
MHRLPHCRADCSMIDVTGHTVRVKGDDLICQGMSAMLAAEREGDPQTASGCQAAIHFCNCA